MAENKMTAYHGTSAAAAASIRKEQHFRESEADNEWLGSGVYFFRYKGHARAWTKGKGDVLTATLEYDDQELLDLDDPDQREALNRIMAGLNQRLLDQITIKPGERNEDARFWCFSCNMYRVVHPEIGIISYTFPRRNPPGASKFPSNARQICVSRHEIITSIV